MDVYRPANPRSRGVGHYRRPGTSASYCGRTVEANPTDAKHTTGVCQVCAKAEARDRVAAEQTAADRNLTGPTLAERAHVRYALVGTGRRIHYSNTDDTLCGRQVTSYTDGPDGEHPEPCSRCITAAEKRAYARALTASAPAQANEARPEAAAAPAVTVHTFESTQQAYAQTQWRDDLRDGAVLAIPSEGVVGVLRSAWPFAITAETGEFHRVIVDPRALDGGDYRASVDRAEEIARGLGAPLAERPEPAIVRADEVRRGDVVLGCYRDGVTVTMATVETAILHSDPYTAAPHPYRSDCECHGCEQMRDHEGPLVTLADLDNTPWQVCDPCPAAAPVLIIRATGEQQLDSDEDADVEEVGTPPVSLSTLADTVACPACHMAAGHDCVTRAGKRAREPHGARYAAVEQAAGVTEHRDAAAREAKARGTWLTIDRKAETALLTAYAGQLAARAQADTDRAVTAERPRAERIERALDAVEYAEETGARVETVEDAEALYAAALVTEADADAGTWRGEWIGEHATRDTEALFAVEQPTEQGALFYEGPRPVRT
ncbi:hypothetical protein [Streptomyces sp. NPDC047046]|uniref:zinc finger domain-containing protein n=1 Tax=Streptomyces sp. NPDC047046 TaxID=3155378 RepID=UPI0033D5757E